MPVVQHSYLKLGIIRKFYFFLNLPIAKSRIVDPIFHLHTICTKIPLPYAAEGLARVKIRCGGLAKPQSRKVRRGGRQTFSTFQVYYSKFLRGGLGSIPPYKGARGILFLMDHNFFAPRNSAGQAFARRKKRIRHGGWGRQAD